jgi:TolB-like protein/DNA-binding winged helix-turn-helix (wHTH) protein/tetratricopeptide (TPR) repeat protein
MRIEFGDHTMDIARRELHCGTAPVAVEPQVFDLLLHLLRNRDRVVSKDDMIAHVWAGRIVSDATIDSRIKAVRRAVGDDGTAQRVIRTIPRKGVRFVADVSLDDDRDGPRAVRAGPAPLLSAELAPPDTTVRVSALAGRPSIAVLAFDNISRDPADEAFADGVAEDITTALSRGRTLLVIARNSSFTYKGRSVDVKEVGRALAVRYGGVAADRLRSLVEVGRALAVRYVLAGSVRRNGDRVRVGAQLIEAESGVHLWAERYDRPMTDAFAVQDEIADAVTRTIVPTVAVAERQRVMTRPPASLDAWEAYQRALGHWAAMEGPTSQDALERAIALDPKFAPAYAVLADVLISAGNRGARPLHEALDLAETAARTAITLDPEGPDGRAMLSRICLMRGDLVAALQHSDDAIALSPNNAGAYMERGHVLVFLNRHAEARCALRMAVRLNPADPTIRVADMLIGTSLFLNREYAAAAAHLRALVLRFPRYSAANRWLLLTLAKLGEVDEARAIIERLADIAPNALANAASARPPWCRQEDYDHIIEALREAGWSG